MGAEIEEGLRCCRVHRFYFWPRRSFRFVRFNRPERGASVSMEPSRQYAVRRFLKTGSEAVSHSDRGISSSSQDTRVVSGRADGFHVSCQRSALTLTCVSRAELTPMSAFKMITCHPAQCRSNPSHVFSESDHTTKIL